MTKLCIDYLRHNLYLVLELHIISSCYYLEWQKIILCFEIRSPLQFMSSLFASSLPVTSVSTQIPLRLFSRSQTIQSKTQS
jgi:hypothetical protein